MSAQSYGVSGVVFGSPAVTGYIVQSNSVSTKPAVIAEVMDENGKRVHARYDDVTSEVSFDAIFQGASLPAAGGTFTVDGITYEVQSIDVKRENKGFKTVSIKGKVSEGIAL